MLSENISIDFFRKSNFTVSRLLRMKIRFRLVFNLCSSAWSKMKFSLEFQYDFSCHFRLYVKLGKLLQKPLSSVSEVNHRQFPYNFPKIYFISPKNWQNIHCSCREVKSSHTSRRPGELKKRANCNR